jgi:AICAR transformylase/IMP cyclohydrolase PurH
MASQTNGNQFRDDEIIILEQLRDGKMVKNIFPKIGGRLRLAHEENDQLSITTEVVRYDESVAVVRAVTTTMKGSFPGIGMASVERDHAIAPAILELAETRAIAN